MSFEAIALTIISSLISGLVGVLVSAWYFYKIEHRKLKMDLARRLLGSRYSISGDQFSSAMNEVVAVFADSPEVLNEMAKLFRVLETPGKPGSDGALVDFLKAICRAAGLAQVTLNDTYLIKTFNARN